MICYVMLCYVNVMIYYIMLLYTMQCFVMLCNVLYCNYIYLYALLHNSPYQEIFITLSSPVNTRRKKPTISSNVFNIAKNNNLISMHHSILAVSCHKLSVTNS